MTGYSIDPPLQSWGTAGGTEATLPADYEALHSSAILVERTDRRTFLVSGNKAAEVLTGLLTNDVLALRPGSGQYAAALTPKGKILADVRLFARLEDFLLDVPAAAVAGFVSVLRKYVNPRLARYREVSTELSTLGVYGPESASSLANVIGLDPRALEDLALYGHLTAETPISPLLVARVPDAGVAGFDVFGTAEALRWLAREVAAHAGVAMAHPMVFEVARIEAGRPAWGIDMDENTLAQEALLDRLQAISFTKGCYLGQETVARVHFRGHVNKLLRGLLFEAKQPVPSGSQLFDSGGKQVGDVRSTARSPQFGAIALGMVRREVEPDSALTATCDGTTVPARVVPLPFRQ
jgi:folate-binding protein YgfZ